MKILEISGAPTNGTSEVQRFTITTFAACVLSLAFMGRSTTVTFAGTEDNTAIDTAVTAALEGLATIGTGGVTVAVSGTTDCVVDVTFAGVLGKKNVDLLTATVAGGAAVAATLTTALTGTNNDLKFTAVTAGTAANSITMTYVDPAGNNQTLSVSVLGLAITVHLATGSGGAITSTGALVRAALIASIPAAALVTPTLAAGNDGTGVVTALTATPLAGGLAAPTSAGAAATTPGVDASFRGTILPSQLVGDTTNGILYVNNGTSLAPTYNAVSHA